jgi:ferric-dicitrate binding protein FerR (iron transport regulator)
MTQYEFDKLLEKYLQGQCSPKEELLLDEWANRQVEKQEEALSEEERKVLKKQLWKRIKRSSLGIVPLRFSWLSWSKLGIAASIIFVCSVLWYEGLIFSKSDSATARNPKGVEMTNTTLKAQLITLNDGTTVNLQPNSSIVFPEKFGDNNRKVYLRGEGFFKVKRDTTKPFYVFAGNLVTEVLGTSFTVKSYDEAITSEVIVLSGKVMVYNQADAKTSSGKKKLSRTILTPNQKIVFEKNTQQIIPQVVENPIAIHPPQSVESFVFDEEPLFDALSRLADVYGLQISPSSVLKDCTFTGDLNDLELYTQLDFICKSINARYEKRGTSIIVTGEGCK